MTQYRGILMRLFIKNMLCRRTQSFVLLELKRLGLRYVTSDVGVIYLEENVSVDDVNKLYHALKEYDLEVLIRQNSLADKIKHAILQLIENNITLSTTFSSYLSNLFSIRYSNLNKYFIKETGMSIGEYYDESKKRSNQLEKVIWSNMPEQPWLN